MFQRLGTPVFHEVMESPPNSSTWTDVSNASLEHMSGKERPFRKHPIIVIGAAVLLVMLLALTVYLAWPTTSARDLSTPANLDVSAASRQPVPVRNPKIPVELSYPVIEEVINPKNAWPSLPARRFISLRLNMKVSEEVLRAIVLELKATETRQYDAPGSTSFFRGRVRAWARGTLVSGAGLISILD